MRKYFLKMHKHTAEHAFKEWKSQTNFHSMSAVDQFSMLDTNDEIEQLSHANESLRLKVDRVKAQLSKQEEIDAE